MFGEKANFSIKIHFIFLTNKDTNVREIEHLHQNKETKPSKSITKHTSELANRVNVHDHIFLTDKNFWATAQ